MKNPLFSFLRRHGLPTRVLVLNMALACPVTSMATSYSVAAQVVLDQKVSLTASSQTIESVLDQLEKQLNVRFVYSPSLIGADRQVTLRIADKSLTQALNELLAPRKIQYEVRGNRIILSQAKTAAANGPITGRVVDAKGEGLPGVTVLLEGTALGSSTDATGAYTIANVAPGSYVLVVSFVGFSTSRIPVTVADGGNVEVPTTTLAESATALGEAVVIGYGSQRRQDVTGAVEQITEKQFVQGQVTSPEQLIQGKVAGVQITTAGGAPGAKADIRIRGGSSLNASNSPLIVIDGVPVDNASLAGNSNPLSLINPADIESITVLKDASSAAIYGSRASNGVIIVTTKRGLQGEPLRVNVSTQNSLSSPAKYVPVLSANEFRNAVNQYGNAQQKASLGTANTDWQREIFRRAFTTDNTVSVLGSAGKVPFRVSGGYLNQQGLLRENSLKRYSGSVGVTPLLLDDNLRIDINIKASLIKNNFSAQDAVNRAVYFDPTQPVRADGSKFGGFFEFADADGNIRTLAPRNPVGLIEQRQDLSTVKRSIGNIQFDYKLPFLTGLSANLNLGYDVQGSEGNLFVPATAGSDFLRNGINRQYKQGLNNQLLETFVKYNRGFGKAKLDLLAGYSWQQFQNKQYRFNDNRADGTLFVAAERTYDQQLNFTDQYNLLSYYGRANLNLDDRFLFTATVRADGSSRFSPDNRWGYFPSGAFAWRLKGEEFLKESKLVSDLKLRLGYGQTGQQDIGEGSGNLYGYLPFYSISSNLSQYQQGTAFYRTLRADFYDLERKWETTTTYNAGLDYGFFGGRLYGSVDVYQRKTSDLLNTVFLAALTNQSNAGTINVGTLTNRGVELSMNVDAVQGEKFNLSLNANATFNRNELTKLTNSDSPNAVGVVVANSGIANFDGEVNQNAQINTVGYQEGAFYVYEQQYGPDGKPLEGQFVDRNADGEVNSKDLYRYKSPRPKAILGFGGNLNYEKVNLAFTFRSNLGNYLYNNQRSRSLFVQNSLGFVRNSGTELLESGFTQNNGNQFLSDYYVEDASFLRLQNLTLGYSFGEALRKGTSLNVSVAAQNLFLVTNYKGLDPEITTGVDNTIYPQARTFTVGLNLGF